MRQIFYVTFMCLCGLQVVSQQFQGNQFIINGTITNSESATIYLVYEVNEERVRDSCKIQQGKFFFKGTIEEPTWAFLKGKGKALDVSDPNTVDFFIEPKTMTATMQYNHFKEIKITGSKTQLEYEMLKKAYTAIDKSSGSLSEKFSAVDLYFIRSHPDSYVSAFELKSYKARWNLDSVKLLYAKLTPVVQNSAYARSVKETIDELDNNSVGKKAKGFKTVDINGNRLSLSDLEGKYVLLDFWGSWCAPCRESTPHLIDLFKKYHHSGLEIVAIAKEYDKTGNDWRAAVKKDGTEIWHNILGKEETKTDKGTDDIVNNYGVHVFPTKILVDKTGTIIGRYTGREQEPLLDKKLSELFK